MRQRTVIFVEGFARKQHRVRIIHASMDMKDMCILSNLLQLTLQDVIPVRCPSEKSVKKLLPNCDPIFVGSPLQLSRDRLLDTSVPTIELSYPKACLCSSDTLASAFKR